MPKIPLPDQMTQDLTIASLKDAIADLETAKKLLEDTGDVDLAGPLLQIVDVVIKLEGMIAAFTVK